MDSPDLLNDLRSHLPGIALEPAASTEAVMVVTAESAVPQEVVDALVASDGFFTGRTVSL